MQPTMPSLTLVEPMAKRKPAQRRRAGHKLHLFGTALALVIGLSLHSCADIPAKREVLAAGADVKALIEDLGTAVREQVARRAGPLPAGLGSCC